MIKWMLAVGMGVAMQASFAAKPSENEESAFLMKSFLAYFSTFSEKCGANGPDKRLLGQLSSRVEQQKIVLTAARQKQAEEEGRKLAVAQLGKKGGAEEQCGRSQRGLINLYNVVEGLATKKWKKT